MPLRIDTSKCTNEPEPQFMRQIADVMYAVGVGQLRNEEEAQKLYRRLQMLMIARNERASTLQYSVIERYIGCHTNVSDVSDFQFNKSIILEITKTANHRLNLSMGGK